MHLWQQRQQQWPQQQLQQRRSAPQNVNSRSLPRRLLSPPAATPSSQMAASSLSVDDLRWLREAATLADASAGLTAPHPNAACILVGTDGRKLGAAFQRGSGAVSAEVQAVQTVQSGAQGATAYLNLESGDCHGDDAAVHALINAQVSRVVIGIRHPLAHMRGTAIRALRAHGVAVDVLGECACHAEPAEAAAALRSVLEVNEALLHRAARRRPLSVLKYAMTLDGKIATQQGHSAWVTSPPARALVFDARARSDAVIVGGNTVRRDNPRLTTRREGGHAPARVVMSRTLDLPEDAALWDTSIAPTIVFTQRGARTSFQAKLRAKGVEVVEFDFLTPDVVADYCYARGFLQCFWECGGTLAAPCISSSVAHKLLAFVAPKVIGGARAPTPVGELGFVEMTQAVDVTDFSWRQVGPDLMLCGYLPSSGGLMGLAQELGLAGDLPTSLSSDSLLSPPVTPAAAAAAVAGPGSNTGTAAGRGLGLGSSSGGATSSSSSGLIAGAGAGAGVTVSGAGMAEAAAELAHQLALDPSLLVSGAGPASSRTVPFYKAWDRWGALSNFSPHTVTLPHFHAGLMPASPQAAAIAGTSVPFGTIPRHPPPEPSSLAARQRDPRVWPSVEHYYQAQKFAGCGAPGAAAAVDAIAAAQSPEEAARIGRRIEKQSPHFLTPGWSNLKVDVMLAALRAKFSTHAGPRALLLSTCDLPPPQPLGATSADTSSAPALAGAAASPVGAAFAAGGSAASGGGVATAPALPQVAALPPSCSALQNRLVEASPHDYFWGAGHTGKGRNVLGQLLDLVRRELLAEAC